MIIVSSINLCHVSTCLKHYYTRMFFVFLDPIAEEILLARYAREEREFTETAAAPPRPVVLDIPSVEVLG